MPSFGKLNSWYYVCIPNYTSTIRPVSVTRLLTGYFFAYTLAGNQNSNMLYPLPNTSLVQGYYRGIFNFRHHKRTTNMGYAL
jgi:hypothetical protein